MDDPDCDRRMLDRTYRLFAPVNAVVSRRGLLYRRDIRPRARGGRPLRILDIGAGGGDLCRLLARRLRRDGIAAHLTALDADPRAVAWASAHDDGADVVYRCATSRDLVEAGDTYDVVLSNHVLHHLGDEQLLAVLEDSRELLAPQGLALHHDIARSRGAHALFRTATWPFAHTVLAGSFIRGDGLVSIRRSYTTEELAAIVGTGWSVRGGAPFRVELRYQRTC